MNHLMKFTALLIIFGYPCATAAENMQAEWKGIDCLVVENATIDDGGLKPEKDFGMANVGHQIGIGKNLVLAIRAWKGFMDGQQFTKATLEFAPPGQTLQRNKPHTMKVIRSYFSDGSAGFVADGLYSWAANPFSSFRVVVEGPTVEVRVNDTIKSRWFNNGEIRRLSFAWSCRAEPRFVWQLNEWEGKPGTDWTSFAPHLGALLLR